MRRLRWLILITVFFIIALNGAANAANNASSDAGIILESNPDEANAQLEVPEKTIPAPDYASNKNFPQSGKKSENYKVWGGLLILLGWYLLRNQQRLKKWVMRS